MVALIGDSNSIDAYLFAFMAKFILNLAVDLAA